MIQEKSLTELYQKYAPMVHRRCLHMLTDSEQAKDALQDVFVKAWENRNRWNVEYPSSLLFRIATNICLNRIRDRKRDVSLQEFDVLHILASVDDIEKQVEAKSLLDRIFLREKESTRVIATLYFYDGMTYEEVAKEVGLSVSGVRKRLRILKQKLPELEKI